ncbi:hypothetical protein L198_06477 [Cryptococcus wingfieldii CBS 7118]|uniref:Cullin N-terminal domain-containing protein n=1 Tax=Cryptococcus wingfieldii CBS 7118 TaxID=1295528 RepID=A0A1E3IKM9_9TREE|nr:hypothetical protein L198_06477 [Cryptococcus wingfieldii CBS 7118]ODN89157.1 hypothetical protein L198_06477 [Cryptococcus wingfieldii CBS 7118]
MFLFSYFYPETSPTAPPLSNDPPSALRPSDTFKEPSKEEVPERNAPLDEIWDFFETGLERLYTLVANPSLQAMSYTYYAMLYSHACDIHSREYDRHMRPGISEHQLYDHLEVFFMKKAQDVIEELAHSDTSREFMEIYSRRWTTYEAFVQRANNLFRGFNHFYADKRIPGVQEINALRLEPGTGVQQANRTGASASKKRRGPMRTTRLETLLEEDDDEVDVEDDAVDVEESDGGYKWPIDNQDAEVDESDGEYKWPKQNEEDEEDDADKEADKSEEEFCIV